MSIGKYVNPLDPAFPAATYSFLLLVALLVMAYKNRKCSCKDNTITPTDALTGAEKTK